jgi:hypothetical protein
VESVGAATKTGFVTKVRTLRLAQGRDTKGMQRRLTTEGTEGTEEVTEKYGEEEVNRR